MFINITIQTNQFHSKAKFDLQRELVIDRNNTKQSDTKETHIGQSVEEMSLKQLKLIIKPTLKQRIIIAVTRKVTTQVHWLFQRKKYCYP